MINSMLYMGKILHSKLRLSFGKKGRHGNEEISTSIVRINVNEEYNEAFRTKSYTDICNKVQGQLETRLSLDEGQYLSSSSSSPIMASPPPPPHTEPVHLLEYLVEPRQETLISLSETSKYHHFIGNYLDISQEAGRIYEFILQNIYQVRVDSDAIRNVMKLIERSPDHTSWNPNQHNVLLKNLTLFSLHSNPFSEITPEKFHELHNSHVQLLHRLTSQCRKTKRRTKFIRCIKRALAVVGCVALITALVVLAMHSMVGVVAAPGLILCSLVLFAMKKLKKDSNGKQPEGSGAQLDITTRGVYTLIKDLDTMSRLVKIVQDEMEHEKSIAETCIIRKGKSEILKKMGRVLQMKESCFQKELEELEKHIYLSFLNINRLRRLLLLELDK